jgi:hypothetical protein
MYLRVDDTKAVQMKRWMLTVATAFRALFWTASAHAARVSIRGLMDGFWSDGRGLRRYIFCPGRRGFRALAEDSKICDAGERMGLGRVALSGPGVAPGK